jgi:hypothetical protein
MVIPRVVKEVVLSLSLMVVIMYKRKRSSTNYLSRTREIEKEEKSNGGREVVVLLYPMVVQAWEIPKILHLLSVTDETDHKGQPQFSQYITIHQKRSDHGHHHRMTVGGAVQIHVFTSR